MWNSSGIAETLDDGRLGPKLVVKGRSDGNSCIIHGIILCTGNYFYIFTFGVLYRRREVKGFRTEH
jgi:hypothetical protein